MGKGRFLLSSSAVGATAVGSVVGLWSADKICFLASFIGKQSTVACFFVGVLWGVELLVWTGAGCIFKGVIKDGMTSPEPGIYGTGVLVLSRLVARQVGQRLGGPQFFINNNKIR